MAVEKFPLSSALVITYEAGQTPAGGPVSRTKTLSNVRHGASVEALYDAAHGLFSLLDFPVLGVVLRENYKLADET